MGTRTDIPHATKSNLEEDLFKQFSDQFNSFPSLFISEEDFRRSLELFLDFRVR